MLTRKLGTRIEIVGDDLFVTNIERIKRGIDCRAANSVLIKLNQIGTVSETIAAIKLARQNKWGAIVSRRQRRDHRNASFPISQLPWKPGT